MARFRPSSLPFRFRLWPERLDNVGTVGYVTGMETEKTLEVSHVSSGNAETAESKASGERLVAIARRHFLSRGFSSVRTEDLAREAGISKKTLYRLFDSKNHMVMAVARSLMADIDQELTPVFEGNAPFPERFSMLMHAIATHVGSISGAFMADLSRHAPEVWEEIDRFRTTRVLNRLEGLIRQGIAEGYVDSQVEPRLAITIIFTLAQNVFTPDRLMELGVGPRDIIRVVLRLLSVGILTEKGRLHMTQKEGSNET